MVKLYTCEPCERGEHDKCEIGQSAPDGQYGGTKCMCPCKGNPNMNMTEQPQQPNHIGDANEMVPSKHAVGHEAQLAAVNAWVDLDIDPETAIEIAKRTQRAIDTATAGLRKQFTEYVQQTLQDRMERDRAVEERDQLKQHLESAVKGSFGATQVLAAENAALRKQRDEALEMLKIRKARRMNK